MSCEILSHLKYQWNTPCSNSSQYLTGIVCESSRLCVTEYQGFKVSVLLYKCKAMKIEYNEESLNCIK
jgi:hypothetical protein